MIIRLRHHDGTKQEWEWTGAPTLGEARLIKERSGLTIRGFMEGFEEMDPTVITALLFVLHRREGNPIAWDDIDCTLDAEPRPAVPVLEFDVEEEDEGEVDVKAQAQRKLAESTGKADTAARGRRSAGASKPS